jgi:meiotically up-regulated gene 157 (Mug157) protein
MEKLDGERAKNLTSANARFRLWHSKGINRDAIMHYRDFGDIFGCEIDGYGVINPMDDGECHFKYLMFVQNATSLPT